LLEVLFLANKCVFPELKEYPNHPSLFHAGTKNAAWISKKEISRNIVAEVLVDYR